MNRRPVAPLCAALCAVAAVFASGSGVAGEIRIDGSACAAAVHLVARDAPLSDVLKRLGNALDFQVNFSSESDPRVNIDVVRAPIELVVRLAPLENMSMTQARNPRCPDRERIVRLWVLPSARGGDRAATAPDAVQVRAQEEQARQAQAGVNVILSAHGIPSSGGQAEPQ